MDFISLKKNLKKDFGNFPQYKLAILGDSSTQFINQALKGYAYTLGINLNTYESDYDQIDHEVFINDSRLYNFKPDFILLFHSTNNLLKKYRNTNYKLSFAEDHLSYVSSIVTKIKENSNCKVFYTNFLELNDGIFGNFSNHLEHSFIYQLRKINFELMNMVIRDKKFYINDISILNNFFGSKFSVNNKLYVNADLSLSLDFIPYFAKNVADIIMSLTGKIKKCLILDLDNTLWGGVIGDDGLDNIQIGNLGIGKAFTLFQNWIKQLKERGIILAICSKNTESIAKDPFLNHPEMILNLDDISIFVANWENKADNIRYIQNILNIGFDSMVFIDDNPFERELVKKELPLVCVPEMPLDPSEYVTHLVNLNLFETSSFSEEDVNRNKLYKAETDRILFKKQFTSEDEYLNGLNMYSEISIFNDFNIPRVAQLTQRSNQFNLRTVRYTEEDIINISNDKNFKTLTFTLKDIYGDHGLISVVIIKKNSSSFFIDTWVMSCRVLKRGMERFIMNHILKIAKEEKITIIEGQYIPTLKNEIVKDLYNELGFKFEKDAWILNVNNNNNFKSYIYGD